MRDDIDPYRCAWPDCGNWITKTPQRGPLRTYCSTTCRQRAWYDRHRQRTEPLNTPASDR